MWLFTKQGFYSAVQDDYCSKDEVMVRARVKGDLVNLLEKIGRPGVNQILTIAHADYRYRVKVTKEEWVKYVTGEAAGINYANVKGTIAHDSRERSKAYLRCWDALYKLQEATEKIA